MERFSIHSTVGALSALFLSIPLNYNFQLSPSSFGNCNICLNYLIMVATVTFVGMIFGMINCLSFNIFAHIFREGGTNSFIISFFMIIIISIFSFCSSYLFTDIGIFTRLIFAFILGLINLVPFFLAFYIAE